MSAKVPSQFVNASRILNDLVEKREIAGGAAAMVQHGQVLYQDYAGYSNITAGQPISEHTIYAIYSMTKVITSVALLRLYEKGCYHMHQPVGDFLPNYRAQMVITEQEDGKTALVPARSPVTMKHLFTMSSGIPYPDDTTAAGRLMKEARQSAAQNGGGLGTRDLVNEMGKVPLAFHPGEKYLYGFSFDVLGGVLEAITGKRFGDYLKEEIFEPLGMKDTGFYLSPEQLDRTALVYRAQGGNLSPLSREETRAGTSRPEFESGGGGLFSTLGDYGRFAQMLLNGGTLDGQRILGRKTVDLMTSDHLNLEQRRIFLESHIGQKGCGYGLGVRVRRDIAEAGLNISPGEYGWDGMAGTWFSADPREDLYVLFMIQRVPGGQDWIHYRMLAAMYAGLE
jgi:CubicO group peptidase (beta-lactamase class C family)